MRTASALASPGVLSYGVDGTTYVVHYESAAFADHYAARNTDAGHAVVARLDLPGGVVRIEYRLNLALAA